MDLALNNLQRLICHKTQQTNQTFLNESELIFMHTNFAIVSTQLNGFNYCYLVQIIQFYINRLFAVSEAVTRIAI